MRARHILWKSVLLLGLCAGLQIALFLVIPPSPSHSDYFAASFDKQAVAQAPGHGRILFAGGSNVAFGVDSHQLERASGRPTINLGLHASLGLRYMINEVVSEARPGDLVVLAPEYEQFFGDLAYGDVTAFQLLEDNHGALRYYLSLPQEISLAKNIGAYNLRKCRDFLSIRQRLGLHTVQAGTQTQNAEPLPPIYARGSFDDRGDLVRHLDRPQPKTWIDPVSRVSDPLNTSAIADVRQMSMLLKSRGIDFCVVFPAVPKSWWQMNGDKADLVAGHLKGLSANTPESAIYDDSNFFDTYYHLNRQGREVRNEALSAILSSGCHPL
jgi:hypothetical protein